MPGRLAAMILLLGAIALGESALAQSPSGCPSAADVEAMADAYLAKTIPSADERAKGKAAARTVITGLADLQRRFDAGEALDAPYKLPVAVLATARASQDPRVAELLRRMAQDQFTRNHSTALVSRTGWGQALHPATVGYLQAMLTPITCKVDVDNTAWMKREVAENGWFVISKYGKQADNAAFLIVQHADRDPAFQTEILALLETLKDKGETRPISYAYLYDRVAVAAKLPQRYATQGRCTSPGVWTPREYENPADIDKVRASVGLMPLEEYRGHFTDLCRNGPFS